MAIITTIVIGTAVVLGTTGAFKFGQSIGGGSLGSVHSLGSESLNPTSLIDIGLDAITSPFASIGNFLLDFLITPLILIAFAILFFTAQYWLFKLYFKLGKSIYDGVVKVVEKITLSNENNGLVSKFSKYLNFD